MVGKYDASHCGDCGSCGPCLCECILVEFDELDNDCCANVVGREFTLSGDECEWTYSEDNFCGPSTGALNLVATLSGTTLTVTVQVQDGANSTTYTLTGTVPTDCRTWFREPIAFASATSSGTPPCNDPPSEFASGRVSFVSCECKFCTTFPEELIIRIGGLYNEVGHEGEFSDCCNQIGGTWVLQSSGYCSWEDSFDICDDELTLYLTAIIVEEDEDTAKLVINAQVAGPSGLLLEVTWAPTFPYPAPCGSGWDFDLGPFASFTLYSDEMKCCDPCDVVDGTGTNVVDPNGDPTCPEPDPILGCAGGSNYEDCCCPQPDCAGE